MTIKAKIMYHMLSTHPDIDYVVDWRPEKIYVFDDVYEIQKECFCGEDDIESYIKRDLRLVAGGGYNAQHISVVRYELNGVVC